MRSIGSRRGNPLLRASVDQSARRRMETWIDPHGVADAFVPGDLEGAPRTRAFFERVREHAIPLMAPAFCVDGAELSYYGADGLALWGMKAAQGLVLAYECADTPSLIVERARRWIGCLRTRTAPGMLDRTWGRPVYGARLDATNDALEVVWATPGDWCGFVLGDPPRPLRWSLPPHWLGAETART